MTYQTFDLNKKQLPERSWLEKEMRARGVDQVINPRSTPYREKNYKDNPPSIEEALDGIEEDPNLLRRPLLVRGKEAVFGFDEGEYGRVVG